MSRPVSLFHSLWLICIAHFRPVAGFDVCFILTFTHAGLKIAELFLFVIQLFTCCVPFAVILFASVFRNSNSNRIPLRRSPFFSVEKWRFRLCYKFIFRVFFSLAETCGIFALALAKAGCPMMRIQLELLDSI